MAEKLLQKLEEKMMVLIAEVESLRQEAQRLRHENATLKQEREQDEKDKAIQMQRISEMIQLIDTVNVVDINSNAVVSRPVLLTEAILQSDAG